MVVQAVSMVVCAGNETLVEWLQSLRLFDYVDVFMKHDLSDMKRVKQLWDLQLYIGKCHFILLI